MTYCCWLSKGVFSPYLAYYSRDFNSSISKSPGGGGVEKDTVLDHISHISELFRYSWGSWNTCPIVFVSPQRDRRRGSYIASVWSSWAEVPLCLMTAWSGIPVIQERLDSTTHWSCWGCVFTIRNAMSVSLTLIEKRFHNYVKTWRTEVKT